MSQYLSALYAEKILRVLKDLDGVKVGEVNINVCVCVCVEF